jgi:glycosyltransferase involved in cell wall biosynthesis
VGEGPDLDRLKQITASKSLSGFVTFAGRVDPEKVSEYYYRHKIFLLPSNFEGHPLTLLEAMAHGCVPVCTLLPQSTDICVEEGISGFLINAGEVKGFGERAGELLANRELLNNLSRNAITRAMDHFSANTSHQKYLELIQSFEGRGLRRSGLPLINRKYMTWKEMVPFQLVLWVKRKILKAI